MKIYEYLSAIKTNDSFDIDIQRGSDKVTVSYQVATLEKPDKWAFLFGGKKETPPADDASEDTKKSSTDSLLNKPSDFQTNEQSRRLFERTHKNNFQSSMTDIRKRLMENMKTRGKNSRVR
jgi:hypothetical protein